MAYIVKKRRDTNTYDTSSIEGYKVTLNDNNSCTYEPFGREYEYYINVPRRCSRCRMYRIDEEPSCLKKKDWKTCKKSYSIKKQK